MMDAHLAGIASRYGTPCYVYDLDEVRERALALRQAFGDRFQLSYAVKSNPNLELLRRLGDVVDRLDISSGGELVRGLESGWAPGVMTFTGPGKRDAELAAAVDAGIGEFVLESAAEARRLDALAAARGVVQDVLVRIAPGRLPRGFGINMAGRPCQFGIDEEDMDAALPEIAGLSNLSLSGFHIYSGTQCLNASSVAENYAIFADVFRRAAEITALRPRILVFGSGLGIPYHVGDEAIDLQDVAEQSNRVLDRLRREDWSSDATLVLELGRYLVGEAGIYLTSVINTKHSRGSDIAICDGGMNHHLGACGHLGSVIHRNYRIFKVGDENDPSGQYDLVGPLCTSIDMIAHGAPLPPLAVGDIIAVRSSGAYGLTASPLNFISHTAPREVLAEEIQGEFVTSEITHAHPGRIASFTAKPIEE